MAKERESAAASSLPPNVDGQTTDITNEGAHIDHMDAAMFTIAKAQERSREELPYLLEEYGPLVEFCRENNVVAPLKNNTYMHALAMTQIMFDRTDTYLRMVTGACGYGFINLLKDPFVTMLKRLRRMREMVPNAGARIIVVNGSNSDVLAKLETEFGDVLRIERAVAPLDAKVEHYIVCDDDMIRDEKPHPPLTPQSPIDTVKADVYFYNPRLAGIFARRFDNLWSQLTQVSTSKAT